MSTKKLPIQSINPQSEQATMETAMFVTVRPLITLSCKRSFEHWKDLVATSGSHFIRSMEDLRLCRPTPATLPVLRGVETVFSFPRSQTLFDQIKFPPCCKQTETFFFCFLLYEKTVLNVFISAPCFCSIYVKQHFFS